MSQNKPTLLSFLVVALVFLEMCAYEGFRPNKDSGKSKEIEQLWADVPIYPGMVPTSSSSSSVGRTAYKGTHFRSPASYEDVKRFYMEKLGARTWEFKNEEKLSNWGWDRGGRELNWRKGEYQFSIEYAGNANWDWDYALSISWYEK